MLKIKHKGDLKKIQKFLDRADSDYFFKNLDKYGKIGVQALSSATPRDSGKTASSWSYDISKTFGKVSIQWSNSNVNKGVNIAVVIQYGHGTGNGAYVKGIDYINPAMKSIFDQIAKDIWKEVTSS